MIRSRVGRHGRIRYKGIINLVTDVDRLAEACIIERIQRAYPQDVILSEESGLVGPVGPGPRTPKPRIWVVDPLDGTTNFAHGFPMFCVAIALCQGPQTWLGVVHHPILQETFTAVRGRGAWLNGKRIRVTREKRLISALLATGFSYQEGSSLKASLELFGRFLRSSQAVRRAGSAALDLAYLACGRFDGFWERDLKPWDVAAGALLVEEAGGRVTDFSGGPFRIKGSQILATNGRLHGQVLKLLKG